jgi:hypothetical protein
MMEITSHQIASGLHDLNNNRIQGGYMPRKGSIDAVGIEKWVDDNSPPGLDYQQWRRMRRQKVSVASLARTWEKTPKIMSKWIDKDDKENGRP